jgi:hypothetical protein
MLAIPAVATLFFAFCTPVRVFDPAKSLCVVPNRSISSDTNVDPGQCPQALSALPVLVEHPYVIRCTCSQPPYPVHDVLIDVGLMY